MSYLASSSSAPNPSPYHTHLPHPHHHHHHHHPHHPQNGHSVPQASDSRRSSSAGQQTRSMPRLGETRCYWALLNEDLRFLFLDPVLNHHLEEQGPALLGHRLLEFVHPDELQSATVDLKAMLDSRTLHGSVTRVRFTRLGSIRKRLGFQGTPVVPEFMRAAGVFYDSEYMPCNIVINVATDGLILCFIHAVIDVSPTEDNDEKKRTGWTNWCGTTTGGLFDEHTSALRQTLASSIPPHEHPHGRVFQVLRHQPGRPTVFSWPPDLPGSDFAQLANRIEMELPSSNHTSDAKTSCTRRYKSDIVIQCSDGLERDIESIFVPYGCIIFACHRTKSTRRMSAPHTATTPVGFTYDGPQAYGYQQSRHVPPQPEWSGSDPWSFLRGPPEPAPAPAPAQTQTQAQPQTQTQALPERTTSPSESRSGSSSTRNSTTLPEPPLHATSPARDESPTEGGKDKKAGANRGGGAPPHGVSKCSNCKIKSSPEWRKGPSGKKDLCNACGLRYARSRAKKEGTAPPPKKTKEKKDGAGPSRNGRKNSAASTASAAGGSYARIAGGAGEFDDDGDGESVPLYASNHLPTQAPPPPPPAARAESPAPVASGSADVGGAYYYAQQQQQQQPVYAYGPGHGHAEHHPALSMLSRAAASEHAHHGYAREHGRSPGPAGGAVYVR